MPITLVEKARNREKSNRRHFHGDTYTKEEHELALAWLRNEVTVTQVGHAIGNTNNMNSYVFIARALKHLYQSKAWSKQMRETITTITKIAKKANQ